MKEYASYVRRRKWFFGLLLFLLLAFMGFSLSIGSARLPLREFLSFLEEGGGLKLSHRIIWEMRLLRVLTAVLVGAALSLSGAVMQCVLENPLASPFTMGISQGAAFGAAFSIVVIRAGEVHNGISDAVTITNYFGTTAFAFAGALVGVLVVMVLARLRGFSPQALILSGIAMSFLFMAGLTLLQFIASDQQLAAIIFWTFGDLGRTTWAQLGLMALVILPAFGYFLLNRWNYNALMSGEEAARSLGVSTSTVRFAGVFVSSLVAAVSVAFVGIIGFVGLLGPHMVRGIVGNDHRFLLPASALWGAGLLLLSDTLARVVISPVVLPVGIITSFMGAPLFLYILVKGQGIR